MHGVAVKIREDWVHGVLNIYNYNKPGKFDEYFKNIFECDEKLEGDIAEIGVFRGSSLLATALFLKEIGSKKKVYGFDSFSGFPSYHPKDDLKLFEDLRERNVISVEHYEKYKLNKELKELAKGKVVDVSTISTSEDFSDNCYESLCRKIDYLKLDNVELIKGRFEETMTSSSFKDLELSVALIDCDLYSGYKTSLPFIWERLSKGGYVYLDEYYSLKFPGARIATDEFFSDKKDKPQMHKQIPGDFERWFVRKLN